MFDLWRTHENLYARLIIFIDRYEFIHLHHKILQKLNKFLCMRRCWRQSHIFSFNRWGRYSWLFPTTPAYWWTKFLNQKAKLWFLWAWVWGKVSICTCFHLYEATWQLVGVNDSFYVDCNNCLEYLHNSSLCFYVCRAKIDTAANMLGLLELAMYSSEPINCIDLFIFSLQFSKPSIPDGSGFDTILLFLVPNLLAKLMM